MEFSMKWKKDLDTYFDIYNTLILEGYIDDEQPYQEENGELKFYKIYELLDKYYSNNKNKDLKKRVIIYDPTESEEKRFKICDDSGVLVDDPKFDPNEDEEPKKVMTYDSDMSSHFYDILHNDIKDLLIDHKSQGVSLDFSKIQYAITEGKRTLSLEMPEILKNMFEKLSLGNDEEPSGYLFIIKMTSRLLSRDGSNNGLTDDELFIFRQLLNISQSLEENNNDNSLKKHKMIILANQIKDLPIWFTDETSNPYIKTINIDKPSETNKLEFFHMMVENRDFNDEFIDKYNEIDNDSKINNQKRNSIEKKFLAYTNDFTMTMLRKYRDYLKNDNLVVPEKIGFSISKFRVGDITNPWDDKERIKEMLNIKKEVEKKIKGQDFALLQAEDILTKAALGLDRSESPNAPRAVLFLAGPTGTGKTELCKQIAECIFGSEDRIVRFDMSEYGEKESDQKLFGAPPGYVGYEEGGKLTNAVKKEPFSLILFDEIEKAHNSILDKFLQILGDGRLTDGHGETVRFTDCIIVITSNAGVMKFRRSDGSELRPMDMKALMDDEISPYEEDIEKYKERLISEGKVNPDGTLNRDAVLELERVTEEKYSGEMNLAKVIKLEKEKREEGKINQNGTLNDEALKEIYDEVKRHLRYNVKAYFHCGLRRPELYGRIEDSIVYYNYISENSVENIVNDKINNAIKSAIEAKRIGKIDCPIDVRKKISDYCQSPKVRALGARGIIKTTGKLFTGSLSNYLSKFVRGIDGHTEEELIGCTLKCRIDKDVITSNEDIKWDD